LTEQRDESVLRDWLTILSRQKWVVVVAVTVAPLLAFAASQSQQHLYNASATVLVNQQNPATAQGLSLSAAPQAPPDRYVATQAKLAGVPEVRELALRERGAPHLPPGALASSSVTASPTDDLLTFAVTNPDPRVAIASVNRYARAFTVYRGRLDVAAVSAAIQRAQAQLDAIAASGGGGSALFRRVQATQDDLRDLEVLQAGNSSARLVGSARSASLVQPTTARNVILAVIAGLALGIASAFLREALDTRVRSAGELQARLGVPLLGQIPQSDGSRSRREAFRMLANTLEARQFDPYVRSIVITSPREQDKSKTAANLAVALAQSGRHVILVDLNLRDPSIAQLFGLRNRSGFTDIATGSDVSAALNVIDVPGADSAVLEVVTAGTPPRDSGEFLLTSVVPEALAVLDERGDVLLIDTPPVLAAGDAMTIAKYADAVILLAGVNAVRREDLIETRRVLEGSPAVKLGVIATGGSAPERAGYLQRVRMAMARTSDRVVVPSGRRVSSDMRKVFSTIAASVASVSTERSMRTRTNGRAHNGTGRPPGTAGRADRRQDSRRKVRDG
jgi:Mrp family chromosome partitioning ATPase